MSKGILKSLACMCNQDFQQQYLSNETGNSTPLSNVHPFLGQICFLSKILGINANTQTALFMNLKWTTSILENPLTCPNFLTHHPVTTIMITTTKITIITTGRIIITKTKGNVAIIPEITKTTNWFLEKKTLLLFTMWQ